MDAPDNKWCGNASLCWAWYNPISIYLLKLLHKYISAYQCHLSSSRHWKNWFKIARWKISTHFFQWNINVIYISFKEKKRKNNPHNFEAFVFDVFSLSSLSQFVDLTFLSQRLQSTEVYWNRICGFCQHMSCLHNRSSSPWNGINMIHTELANQNTKQEMCPRSCFSCSPKTSSTHQSGSDIFPKKKSGDKDTVDNSI